MYRKYQKHIAAISVTKFINQEWGYGNNLLRDKIYLQTLQGDDKTRDKIIKNISKEVLVDKD